MNSVLPGLAPGFVVNALLYVIARNYFPGMEKIKKQFASGLIMMSIFFTWAWIGGHGNSDYLILLGTAIGALLCDFQLWIDTNAQKN
jgi:hypothetical protein